MMQKGLILFSLLSIIGLAILISIWIVNSIQIDRLTKELIVKNKRISEEQLKNNQSIGTIQQLNSQLKQLKKESKLNIIIFALLFRVFKSVERKVFNIAK